jgi:hypothetical protein
VLQPLRGSAQKKTRGSAFGPGFKGDLILSHKELGINTNLGVLLWRLGICQRPRICLSFLYFAVVRDMQIAFRDGRT